MSTPVPSRDAELLRTLAERIDPADPGAFNNLGVLYHSKGMYAEAVTALLMAVTIDPRMPTAMRNLELAAARDGACDARLAALSARIAAKPDDRAAAREEARLLRLIGRHAESAHKLDALIAEDPEDGAALLERGWLEQRTGDLRRAQRWFERATNADGTNPIARLQLAEVMYQRGLNEQSLETLDGLLALEPDLSDAHLLRSFVLGDLGQNDAATLASRRAAALNPTLACVQPNLSLEHACVPVSEVSTLPTDASAVSAHDAGCATRTGAQRTIASRELARYGLGLAFRQRGYFTEARQQLTRALAHGEDESLVRHALAEIDLVLGRHDDAIAAYRQLLTAFGEQARWQNELGVALHQSGDLTGAAEAYRRAVRNDPRYAFAYNNLGVVLSDQGEGEAAREALERAATIEPTFVRAKLNRARSLARHDNLLGALGLLNEVTAFHGDNADVWNETALVLVALGRTDDAHRALATAISCDGNHAGARYALAELLHQRGDHDGALRETTQALAHAPMRPARRLTVSIELQRECPEAVGSLDLLALRATTPLVGAAIDGRALAELLPERAIPEPTREVASDVFGGVNAISTVGVKSPVDDDVTEADAFAARGLHGEALERYERECAMTEWAGPHEVWRRAAIGVVRAKCLLGRGAEARELLERLLAESDDASSDFGEVLALLAASRAAAWAADDGEPRLARAAIAQFLRVESRSAALLHFVGDVAMSMQEDSLAIVLFRRALAVDPSRPTPRVAIARLLRRRNDVLAARLELVAALAVAPALRDAVLELARLHCDTDHHELALSLLINHLHRDPTDTDALALLAHTLLLSGRTNDARLAVARARRHDALHPLALWLDGRILADQQRVREARDRWTQVIAAAPTSEAAGWARRALDDASVRTPAFHSENAEVSP
jgi:tetratricopeptide (TPR) repeat protein